MFAPTRPYPTLSESQPQIICKLYLFISFGHNELSLMLRYYYYYDFLPLAVSSQLCQDCPVLCPKYEAVAIFASEMILVEYMV